jgi:putative membrane protein
MEHPMNALFAFLHHLAAFGLFAALIVEFVLIRGELTVANARRLITTDLMTGICAGAVLAAGLARVFWFEKGADYYFHSAPFLIKLSLFVVVGLLSIYPTMKFLSWRGAVKQGRMPVVDSTTLRMLRRIIHAELAGAVLIILCAVLMARGAGHLT